MSSFNVLVIHERTDWKRTDVDVDAPYGTETKELVAIAREQLRQTDYATYCFVTERPLQNPKEPKKDPYE